MDITVFCKTVMWSKILVPRYANQHIIIIQKVSDLLWYHNLVDMCYDPQDGGTADLSWEQHFTTLTMTDANKCYKL